MQRLILIVAVVMLGLGHAAPARADIFQLVNPNGAYLPFIPYEVRNAGARVSWGATDAVGRLIANHAHGRYDLVVRLRGQEITKSITLNGAGDLKRVTVP